MSTLAELIIFLIIAIVLVAFADEIGNFLKRIKIPFLSRAWVKHMLALVGLTILLVVFNETFSNSLRAIESLYRKTFYLVNSLIGGFSVGDYASIILSLLIISAIPWLLLTGLYHLIDRNKSFPYCAQAIWFTWIILVMAVIL